MQETSAYATVLSRNALVVAKYKQLMSRSTVGTLRVTYRGLNRNPGIPKGGEKSSKCGRLTYTCVEAALRRRKVLYKAHDGSFTLSPPTKSNIRA